MAEISSDNQVYETEIDVEGVEPERQQAAVDEIRWFLQILSKASGESQGGVMVRRIVIARDFNAAINELSSICKTYGTEYKAQRRSVQAIAKTIEDIENEKISFSLVFDGKIFGSWEKQAKAIRFEKFLHELAHVLIDSARFKKLGTRNFYPDWKTAEGVCLSLALVTQNEYVVDRMVDELCQKFLTDDVNQPVPLSRLYSAEGLDFRAPLLELVNKMPGFIIQNVRDFREGHTTVDELWPHIYEFLEELLTVLAHCAAIYDQKEEWIQTLADISQRQAYGLFLGGHVEAIYKEWQRLFNEPGYDETKSLEATGNEIRGIFHRCGLTLTNVPEGIYVSVDVVEDKPALNLDLGNQ